MHLWLAVCCKITSQLTTPLKHLVHTWHSVHKTKSKLPNPEVLYPHAGLEELLIKPTQQWAIKIHCLIWVQCAWVLQVAWASGRKAESIRLWVQLMARDTESQCEAAGSGTDQITSLWGTVSPQLMACLLHLLSRHLSKYQLLQDL